MYEKNVIKKKTCIDSINNGVQKNDTINFYVDELCKIMKKKNDWIRSIIALIGVSFSSINKHDNEYKASNILIDNILLFNLSYVI